MRNPGRRNDGLDPETDHVEIYRNLVLYEFPWDFVQSLSFALFRTFAVPSIGGLLDRTHEFARHPQRRYDDTSLLLELPLLDGFDTARARTAIRRINQMHHAYDIGNDDLRYVLATFVVVPRRWLAEFGWRPLTDNEVRASVNYYRELGRHLGVHEIPPSYSEFEQLLDAYERDHFAFDPGARRVARSTLTLLASFYPPGLRAVIDPFSRALMDPPLLTALGLADPGPALRRISRVALRARARLIAGLPARRRPRLVSTLPRIRSYPDGFDPARAGTFPSR